MSLWPEAGPWGDEPWRTWGGSPAAKGGRSILPAAAVFAYHWLTRCAGQATNSGLVQGKKVFTTEVASIFSHGDFEARQFFPDLVYVPDPCGASGILRMLVGRLVSVGLLKSAVANACPGLAQPH